MSGVSIDPVGMTLLQRVNNAAGASSTVDSGSFGTFNMLCVMVRIAGYTAASTARLQFNGDTGTTAYSYSISENFAVPTTAVAAVAAGIAVATTNQVGRALITFFIRNIAGQEHGITILGGSGSLVAATAPVIVTGSGIWATTNQITRVVLDVGPGGGNLAPGTELTVYGMN